MSSPIDLLKQVKIPIWARLLGRYRAWRHRIAARKQVHYVTTVFSWMYWTDTKTYSRRWYICKVRGDGKRFFEYGTSDKLLGGFSKDSEYARIIVPWLHGKYSNEQITSYGTSTEKVKEHGTEA